MGAVWLTFRACLRRRWRSWLAIAALISIVGGAVLSAAAAGRRTQSAFPAFVATHGFDAGVFASQPVPQIATLPGVVSVNGLKGPDNGQPTCSCTHPISRNGFAVLVPSTRQKGRGVFQLVSGRRPDPSDPDQVLASFTLESDGVHLGSVFRVPLYARSQAAAYGNATGVPPKPTGPTVALRVVGFEASELEFPSGEPPLHFLYATPAFARTVVPSTAITYFYEVRLRHGSADQPSFEQATRNLQLSTGSVAYLGVDEVAASIESAIHPQAIGWWLLAGLAALVGLAVVGQALSRQSIIESADYPALAALGTSRTQLIALAMARNLTVAIIGAAGAVAVATALSPIAPLGEARAAETSTGLHFDPLVLPLGALATVAVVLVLGFWPATRAARTRATADHERAPRASAVAARLAAAGAPPSAVIGIRHAMERNGGGATVPVGSALLGTVLAVIALCGTVVFGASLSHLTATPKLYGDPFQLTLNANGGPSDPALVRRLAHDSAVTGITNGLGSGEAIINKVSVAVIVATSERGQLLFSTIAGHLPDGPRQIALGTTTMRQVGARLGSVIHIASTATDDRGVSFDVVGQVSFPVIDLGVVGLGRGALITTEGLEYAACPAGTGQAACRKKVGGSSGGSLISFVGGQRGRAARDHYLHSYESIAALPVTPTSLVNFGEAVNFPLIFGTLLAVFGAATLTHLLVVSVSRRRREIGLLKVLGFVNRQAASIIGWQATTLALVGIAVGIPLGVVIGRAAWLAFASNLGVVPVSVVPIRLLVVLAVGVLAAANLIAFGPALRARGSTLDDLLRVT